MAAETPFRICSRALILVGANPITSFDDGTTESTVAGQVYTATSDALLALPRWTFAKKWKALERKPGEPLARGEVHYHLPADMLSLHAVLDAADNPVRYTLGDGTIVTRSEGDYTAEYAYRAPESVWPPLFVEALVSLLASKFALAVARNEGLSEAWLKRYRAIDLPTARSVDAQSQTSRRLRTGRFARVRG